MASPNIQLDITDKNELIRVHGVNGARRTTIAQIDPEKKTIFWKDEETRAAYHKSVDAFLSVEKIVISNSLLQGQTADVRPASSPPPPRQHKMQGDLTPAYLQDLYDHEPIRFENVLGVVLKPAKSGQKRSEDPREDWMRADVIRTISGPTVESRGGVYESVRFKAKQQIIARRRSHLTFEAKEIYKGDTPESQAEPYVDPYGDIAKQVKDPGKYEIDGIGKIDVVWKRHAAATAGASF